MGVVLARGPSGRRSRCALIGEEGEEAGGGGRPLAQTRWCRFACRTQRVCGEVLPGVVVVVQESESACPVYACKARRQSVHAHPAAGRRGELSEAERAVARFSNIGNRNRRRAPYFCTVQAGAGSWATSRAAASTLPIPCTHMRVGGALHLGSSSDALCLFAGVALAACSTHTHTHARGLGLGGRGKR